MKKEYLRVISEYVGVFHVNINSNLVSAQNRDRWYWTNIRIKKVGLFEELYVDIPQPKDRGILLKDILESEVDEKYFISEKALERVLNTGNPIDKEKSFSVNASDWRGLNRNQHQTIISVNGKAKPNQDKASCFTAGAHSGGNHSDMDLICVAMRGRNPDNPSDRSLGSPTEQRLEPKTDGKTNCLTSVAKDNLVMCLTPKRTEYGKQIRKEYESGEVTAQRKEISQLEPREDNKTNTLTTVQKDNLLTTQSRIRRLTPTECSRLQTIPEWYKWECSDTQIYRMCGNGWTVEVIKHILSYLSIFGKDYQETKKYVSEKNENILSENLDTK